MESLGDILKRLGDTTSGRRVAAGGSQPHAPPGPEEQTPACPACGGRGWFTPEAPAGHPDFGRVVTCECQRERIAEERTARLLRYSNIGHLTRFTFDALNTEGLSSDSDSRAAFREAYAAAAAYAEAPEPEGWLVLAGPTGSGKTHLSAAIANRCIENGKTVFFAHVPDLLDHLRASFGPDSEVSYTELFEQVRSAPMLVLDELDARGSTPWAHEKLRQIVNHRCSAQLPTVVTTGGVDELDPYIAARLRSAGRVVPLPGARPQDPLHRLGAIEPEMLRRMTFDTFDVRGNNPDDDQQKSLNAAFKVAKSYAEDPDGWLTLFGEAGVGKTHLAVAIASARIEAGHPVFFAFVPDLLDHLRYTFMPDSRVTYDRLFDEVKGAELLLLDDLGKERTSPWAQEKLYQIIVHRHNARLPTIVTTSLDFTKEKESIASRFRDGSVVDMHRIEAPDYRPIARRPRARKKAARRAGAPPARTQRTDSPSSSTEG